jgi:hypothetical protein
MASMGSQRAWELMEDKTVVPSSDTLDLLRTVAASVDTPAATAASQLEAALPTAGTGASSDIGASAIDGRDCSDDSRSEHRGCGAAASAVGLLLLLPEQLLVEEVLSRLRAVELATLAAGAPPLWRPLPHWGGRSLVQAAAQAVRLTSCGPDWCWTEG